MATVAAIFDDAATLEGAISALEQAGLGDAIAHVSENREADTAPETSETGETDTSTGVSPALGAGGMLGAGSISAQGSAPLFGGFFGSSDPAGGYLDRLGDDAEPFRLAAEHGGKLIVLETDDVDEAITTLRRAGARQLYDPR
jgi:hypothetical protein